MQCEGLVRLGTLDMYFCNSPILKVITLSKHIGDLQKKKIIIIKKEKCGGQNLA